MLKIIEFMFIHRCVWNILTAASEDYTQKLMLIAVDVVTGRVCCSNGKPSITYDVFLFRSPRVGLHG